MAGLWGASDYFDPRGFFGNVGGAINDLFAAEGKKAEAQSYGIAAKLADKNAEFAAYSTSIKKAQAERDVYKAIGSAEAGIAGSGFELGGSGMDIIRESMQQGALTQEVLTKQGQIAEDSYHAQAKSYRIMESTAKKGILGSSIAAGLKLFGAATAL